MRTCLNHPLVETARFCARCKCPACNDCLVPLKGRDVCAGCKHATLAESFRAQPVHAPATYAPWSQAPAAPAEPSYPPGSSYAPSQSPYTPVASPETGAAAWTAPPITASRLGSVLGNCAYHPNVPAYTTCERCGDFTCALCVTAFDGRNYCVRCVDLMWDRGTLEAPRFTEPRTALIFGVMSLLCWLMPCYGLFPTLLACGFGFSALQKIAAKPDLPGKKQAVAGLTMGIIGTVCSIGFWIWSFYFGMR